MLSPRSHNDYRAEQEKAAREREREWKRQEEDAQSTGRRTAGCSTPFWMHSGVADADDYEMLVVAAIERLEYEAFDAACERYKIDTDEVHEPDAAAFELRKLAQGKTEAQLVRMVVELALLPSGFSDETLPPHEPLASAAARYGVSLDPKKQAESQDYKCAPKATQEEQVKADDKAKTAPKKAAK